MQSRFQLPSPGSLDGSRSRVVNVAGAGDLPIALMMKQDCQVTELLIYQTVLLATICLTSLDNSEVFERGIGRHIVPFL